MAPVYIGLIHYPIYNKHMEVVTTALTNYDLHDIARTAKTYDVKRYFIVHPVEAQREMASRIMNHWKTGGGVHYNINRKEAFEETELVPTLEDAIAWIKKRQAKTGHRDHGRPGLSKYCFLHRNAQEDPRRRYADLHPLWYRLWHDQGNDETVRLHRGTHLRGGYVQPSVRAQRRSHHPRPPSGRTMVESKGGITYYVRTF